ncbi:hypothetical protein [Ferrimonas aestuarii]|uniref:Uncharacterized protein n=1 Tax=Ferrimonas aestuarii TaxID=2569539 RepID=A0A4U1BNF6_9GAMM|nr:hypothetical protein [Ferrimonas aestuarii]TKB53302.1 hypothetical protein FCL42_14625 [Ferrimonas aestuarii]
MGFGNVKARLDSRVFAQLGDALSINGQPVAGVIEDSVIDLGDAEQLALVLKVPKALAVGITRGTLVKDGTASYKVAELLTPQDGLAWFELKEA